MQEKWRQVIGYEGFYEVSNWGRVRSVDREVVQHGGSKQLKRGKVLSPATDRLGYINVALSFENKLSSFKVHRLVAAAWVLNPKGLNEINHKNGLKSDNRAANLEWSTRSENIRHAIKNGLLKYKIGSDNAKSLLKEDQRIKIRSLYFSENISVSEIARAYNVNLSTIYRVLDITKTLSK